MQFVLTIIIFTLIMLAGMVVAGFFTTLIFRIPRRLSFLHNASFCPECEHRLTLSDVIPVVSYLALGRRCRYCHRPISPRYPLIELAGGLLALASWLAFMGASGGATTLFAQDPGQILLAADPQFLGTAAPIAAAILTFAVLCILLAIAIIDADTMEIPNGLNLALLVLGLLSMLTGPELDLLSRILGVVAVSLPLFILSTIIPGAFGGGDIKLLAVAGLLLGWQRLLLAFLVGLVIGGGYGIFALIGKRKGLKEHFAFGPSLCVGIATALFGGFYLVDWYKGLL